MDHMASNDDDMQEPAPKRQRRSLGAADRVTLDVGGEKFVCGSSTLTNCSAYFASLLSDNWIESNNGDEIFLDQDPAAFRKLLAYMRRGMIQTTDVDIDVLILAEFLGIESLLRAAKIRWYCNLGRGPLVSGKTDEEIAALFDQYYGGIMNAVSRGLFPRFHTYAPESEAEKDIAELRVALLENSAIRVTCVKEANGEDPTEIISDSMVGALNGLFDDGYTKVEVPFSENRVAEVVHQQTFQAVVSVLSRRRHSVIRSDATKIFIPSDSDASDLRKANVKIQFASWARTLGGQEIIIAPANFNDSDQERTSPCATVTIAISSGAKLIWMRKHGFSLVREEAYSSFEKCLENVLNRFDSENGVYKKVKFYQKKVPLAEREVM